MKKGFNNKKSVTSDSYSIWSAALFISGASLGAGLLALPVQTGLVGLLPALSGLIVIWGLMFISGLILVESFVEIGQPSAGLYTLYEKKLGRWSGWLVAPGFLIIFYGLLVAYLSGSGTVLADLLHLPQLERLFGLLFFLVCSGIVLVGMKFINRANAAFMFLLIGSFIALILLVGKNMVSSNLVYQDWRFLPSALPIIICAFAYQNVIPSICTSLNNDRGRIRKALLFGTLLTLLVNGLWILVVLGVLPVHGGPDSLLSAFEHNQPATIPLALDIHSEAIGFWGLLFSMAALFTSYVAVGEGLRNFLADLLAGTADGIFKVRLVAVLTFIPPLAVSLSYPHLFLKMLNIVGGLGVVLLFGLLPALMLVRQSRREKNHFKQSAALLLCLICTVLIIFECGQELGFLQIKPQAEYWNGK